MNIILRNLSKAELTLFDDLAHKAGLSRDKYMTEVLQNHLRGDDLLKKNRAFFNDEVSKIIDVIKENNKVIEQAYDFLEKE